MVVDELLRRHTTIPLKKASFEGELFKNNTHYFLKPMTYMNRSGESILAVKNFYKIDDIVVIHDDLDLPFGTLRFKFGGGSGGHNGLRSTDMTIGQAYVRVRMGIGKPLHKAEVSSYVLSPFSAQEQGHLAAWINHTADAIEMLSDTSWENVASKCSIKKFQLQ